MIISRAPFRVSFAGGGTDIPSFYEKHGGCVLSTTIKKYVYLTIHPAFNRDDISLKYSKTENVHNYQEIEPRCQNQHEIVQVKVQFQPFYYLFYIHNEIF